MFFYIVLLWVLAHAVELSELNVLERRRMKGSASGFKCIGQRNKEISQHLTGAKPSKMMVQYMSNGEEMINYARVKYDDVFIDAGHYDNDSQRASTKMPRCVQYVFVKSDGTSVNGLRFYSHTQHTKMFGWDTNDSYLITAPEGKCLGDMKLGGEEILEQICVKFNANEI